MSEVTLYSIYFIILLLQLLARKAPNFSLF